MIKKGILKEDLLEAIICLPKNLFFDKGIPACLFIINKNKSRETEREDLFSLWSK